MNAMNNFMSYNYTFQDIFAFYEGSLLTRD
uniref:Uncharacterized protein n=1 Tax=Arundo donax TaxID=35708 RepID=A0A0A9B1G4_ARUDO